MEFSELILEPFQSTFNRRALLAALMIGFANGYLSGFVVLRKSALTVGSLSHSLLPGLAVGAWVAGLSVWSGFIGALVAALIVGLGALFVSRSSRLDHDSALAILYTTAFAGGLVLISRLSVNIDLEHWLFGNIVGLADHDLWMAFWVSSTVLVCFTAFQRPILVTLFEPSVAQSQGVPVTAMNYLLMSLLILGLVTSLQAVGCILSLSLLVAPAATIYQFANSPRALFWGGAVVGSLCAGIAVWAGYWLEIRTGAAIVLLLGLVFGISFLLSPRYGLLARAAKRKAPAEHTV